MRRTVMFALVALTATVGCDVADTTAPEIEPELDLQASHQASDVVRSYRVTVTNLTSSQPLTPPLVATHERGVRLYRVGRRASEGIKEIAENGNLGVLQQALTENPRVHSVVIAAGDPPPLLQGESITFEITSSGRAFYLSWASMLICTNDGFTGNNRVFLPRHVGQKRWARSYGFDAGTERNTEDFADIVPPCQIFGATSSDDEGTGMSNPALATHERVRVHRGIHGGNDLVPELHGWRNPVASISVERIG